MSKGIAKKWQKRLAWFFLSCFFTLNLASFTLPVVAEAATTTKKPSAVKDKANGKVNVRNNGSQSGVNSKPLVISSKFSAIVTKGKYSNNNNTNQQSSNNNKTVNNTSNNKTNSQNGGSKQKGLREKIDDVVSTTNMVTKIPDENSVYPVFGYWANKFMGDSGGKVVDQSIGFIGDYKTGYYDVIKQENQNIGTKVSTTKTHAQALTKVVGDLKKEVGYIKTNGIINQGLSNTKTFFGKTKELLRGGVWSKLSFVSKVAGPVLGGIGGGFTIAEGIDDIKNGQKLPGVLNVIGGTLAIASAVAMVAFPPAALVIGGVALATTASASVIKNWKEIKAGAAKAYNFGKSLLNDPSGTGKRVWNGLKNNLGTVALAAGSLIMAKYGKGIVGAIGKGVKKIGGAVLAGAKKIGGAVLAGAKKVGKAVVAGAKKVGKAVVAGAKKIGKAVVAGARKVGKTVVAGAKKIGKAVVAGARKVGKTVAAGARKVGKAVATGARKVRKAVVAGVKKVRKAVATGVKKVGKSVAAGAKKIGKAVATTTKKVYNSVKTNVVNTTKKITSGISSGVKSVGSSIKKGFKKLFSW